MKGWIRLYRDILNWEHFTEPSVLSVWICLLTSTRPKAGNVKGVNVARDEAFISYRDLREYTGLSVNTVKNALDKLVASGEIQLRPTRVGTVVKIVKYSRYQSSKGVSMVDTPTDTPTDTRKKGGVSTIDTPTDTPTDTPLIYSSNYINSSGKKNRRIEEYTDTNVSGGKKKKNGEKIEKAVTRYDVVFEDIFKQLTGDTFIWSKRENVAVNTIVGKIAKMMEDGGLDATNADAKEANFKLFLTKLYEVGDTWIRTNFVPHVIADKFTEYYQRIKYNGKHKITNNNPTGVSNEYLEKISRELSGEI